MSRHLVVVGAGHARPGTEVTTAARVRLRHVWPYLVTVCARECLFGEVVDDKMQLSQVGRIVEKCWSEIPFHFPAVTRDRVIRDEDELRAFRRYVAENPLRRAIDRENPLRL